MHDDQCLGDIDAFASIDACDDCARINDCSGMVISGYSRAKLKEYFGFSDDNLDELRREGHPYGEHSTKGSTEAREPPTPENPPSSQPISVIGIVSKARHQFILRKRRATMTDEEKATTTSMSKRQFERWLGGRRVRRYRTDPDKNVSRPAVPLMAATDIKTELARRRTALAAWVEANRRPDKFARSLGKPSAQKAVLAAWIAREQGRARTGVEPTFQAIADRLGKISGRPWSRQQAGRLIDKINKLEAEGRPWHRGR